MSKFELTMFGGKRSALVNAANLCAEAQLASARLIGHNNRGTLSHPVVQARCGGHEKHKAKKTKKKRGGR